MKASAPWIGAALLAGVAALLVLNLRERDHFVMGSLEAVDAHDPPLPPSWSHEACEHPLELLESKGRLTLRDRDGWHRLFWAGDETYYYQELTHLAAELANPTASDPRGSWRLIVRPGPGACGRTFPAETLTYALEVTETPRPAALTYSYSVPHLPAMLSFVWMKTK
jgi:hypothetical protein